MGAPKRDEGIYEIRETVDPINCNEIVHAWQYYFIRGEKAVSSASDGEDLIRPQIALKPEHLTEENKQLAEAMIRKANIAGQIEQLKKSLDSAICHACGQALHQSQRESAGSELGRLEAEFLRLSGLSVRRNEARFVSELLKETARSIANEIVINVSGS